MATLAPGTIAALLQPYYPAASDSLILKLSTYLDLLVRWNQKTNLTAIREPQEMVRRHFGESLFASLHVPPTAKTLVDLGSGAGFPGLPIQLALPILRVTLAESQNKKAAFLREAVRVLGLQTEIVAARVETLPASRRFDVVAMRAVDDPALALELAACRLVPGGTLLHLTSGRERYSPEQVDHVLPESSTVLRVSRG